jgi:hypothetical protein
MAGPPIPQRIPPLSWRRPAILWTPVALAIAIGWPAALFYQDAAPQRIALIASAAVFALALTTLGVSWAMGRAPRARRIVVLHVVVAGVIAALLAPFVLTELLKTVADIGQAGAGEQFTLTMSLAMVPLALVLGLPIALISGIIFAWTALVRRHGAPGDVLNDGVFRNDVQPFR